MALLVILVGVSSLIYPWWLAHRWLRRRRTTWLISFLCGSLWGSVCMFFSLGLLVSMEQRAVPQGIFCMIALLPLAYGNWRMYRQQRVLEDEAPGSLGAKPESSPVAVAHDSAAGDQPAMTERFSDDVQLDFKRQIEENERLLAETRELLDAMRSQKLQPEAIDNEVDADPVQVRKSSRRRKRVEGTKIDTIQFDYVNAKDEFSQRRVVVRVIDDEYFEGLDVDIRQIRTFRIDGIIGDVTSESTGEVLEPDAWARARRAEA